jgi:hypothetical protein
VILGEVIFTDGMADVKIIMWINLKKSLNGVLGIDSNVG